MEILIFDMDGVLVKPWGYYHALQETVRLAGISTGFGEVLLTDQQITRFEALGISSEWHSSALCMAFMQIEKQTGEVSKNEQSQPVILNLEGLFEAIALQPMRDPAIHRGQAAVEELAAEAGISEGPAGELVAESESILSSPTLNWFQELILGSENYTEIYHKKPQFRTESYLRLYDERLLNESQAAKILKWVQGSGHGAAIMTNRPSHGPSGFSGMPDTEMGSNIVGLSALPLVGKGELLWLAAHTGRRVEDFAKPAWAHAMATILMASGWSAEQSLNLVGEQPADWNISDLRHLHMGRVTIFEDTPGGMVAVQEVGDLLNGLGLRVELQKIGIAEEVAKQSALSVLGAAVYPDINQALESLDYF